MPWPPPLQYLLENGLSETPVRRRRRTPYRVYGYPVTPEWLVGYARKLEADPNFRWGSRDCDDQNVRSLAPHNKLTYVIARIEDGGTWGAVHAPIAHPNYPKVLMYCFEVGDNLTAENIRMAQEAKDPRTKGQIEYLQETLGVQGPPRWFKVIS